MRAHPAGPRHADVLLPANTAGPPPADAQALDAISEAVWPRGAQRGRCGEVQLAGVALTELAEQFGSPLFVLDEEDFRSRAREFAAAFGSADAVHYAAKAFLSTQVAGWVDEEGLRLDVCSGGELELALRAGFPAERIALHGNNKSRDELAAAVRAGVGAVVLDSDYELARLNAIAVEQKAVVAVMVRVTVGVEAHTHEFIATAHEDQKFGFSLSEGQAAEAAARVLASEHLRLVGLHSHIGSQIFDADGFEVAAHRVMALLAQLHAEHGAEAMAACETVDLGGGFGISYTELDDPPAVGEIATSLREIVAREASAQGLQVPKLAVEPGRAIVGPAGVTVYTVGTVKDVVLDGRGQLARRYVSVDGGMSDNLRTALYDAVYDCRRVSRHTGEAAEPALCRVVGKHCESGDVVVRDCWLPDDLATGDLLAVPATGAYCYSMSSRYNLVERPAVVTVADGRPRLMIRRETLDDLVRLEVE